MKIFNAKLFSRYYLINMSSLPKKEGLCEKDIEKIKHQKSILFLTYINEKLSRKKIVSIVGVSISTISREINRNSVKKQGAEVPCSCSITRLCNKFKKNGFCNKVKIYYDFKEAEKKSKNIASSSRSKPKISIEDLKII